jgi:hypothetical protein
MKHAPVNIGTPDSEKTMTANVASSHIATPLKGLPMKENAKSSEDKLGSASGTGLVLGGAFGLVVGAVLGNPGLGLVFGAALGIVFGAGLGLVLDARAPQTDKPGH